MNTFFKSIFEDKKNLFGLACAILGICIFAYYIFFTKSKPENLSQTLQDYCKQVPENFQKKGNSGSLGKSDGEIYEQAYSSTLSYEEIKDYYAKRLLPQKWKMSENSTFYASGLNERRSITFYKDEFEIRIGSISESETDPESLTFSLSCSWAAF